MLRYVAALLTLSVAVFSARALAATDEVGRGADVLVATEAGGAGQEASDTINGLVPLAITGTLAIVEPALQVISSVTRRPGVHALERKSERRLPKFVEVGETSSFSYPVARSVRIGVGYRFVTVEDLRFEAAKAGSLDSDYESHNILLQARWRF